MFIYKTTNNINGKIYVGKQSSKRKDYLGSGIVLSHAIKKYGKESFSKEILEECFSFEELNQREIFWIEKLNSRNADVGYNLSIGGDGFSGFTEEMQRKMAEKRIGRKFSKEHRENISKGKMGVLFSEEHKSNLSIARKARITTDETRKKCSATSTGKINIKNYLVEDQDGNLYNTTSGMNAFCREHNLHRAHMQRTLTNNKKHKGWRIIKCLC